MGEGVVRESGMDRDTLLHFTWITNKDLLFSTGDSAPCYVAAWMWGGVWGRMDRVCGAEFLCCSPEAITALFLNHLSPNTK